MTPIFAYIYIQKLAVSWYTEHNLNQGLNFQYFHDHDKSNLILYRIDNMDHVDT